MGSGKTHWGKIWAEREKVSFYDLDEKIEKACGMTIADIFEKKGEEKFREIEQYHLREFGKERDFLLACGGGTPCFYDNIEWMKSQGKVFYLKAKPELMVKHLVDETTQRPVIKNLSAADLLPFVKMKLSEREPFYERAHHVLNVDQLNEDSLSPFL